jgi:hypothetical protein
MTTQTIKPTCTFHRRLEEIRQRGRHLRDRRRATRADSSLERTRRILASIRFLERVERRVTCCIGELVEELSPDICLERRFFDGRWMLAARLDELWLEPDGCPRLDRSRLTILLAPDVSQDELTIECRVTVRGHDLPAERRVVQTTDGGLAALTALIEERCLALAASWFRQSDAVRATRRPLGAVA